MKLLNEAVTTVKEAVIYVEKTAPMCIDCTGNCWG